MHGSDQVSKQFLRWGFQLNACGPNKSTSPVTQYRKPPGVKMTVSFSRSSTLRTLFCQKIWQLWSHLNLGINMIILLWLVLGFVAATGDLFRAPVFPWLSKSEQLRPLVWTGCSFRSFEQEQISWKHCICRGIQMINCSFLKHFLQWSFWSDCSHGPCMNFKCGTYFLFFKD